MNGETSRGQAIQNDGGANAINVRNASWIYTCNEAFERIENRSRTHRGTRNRGCRSGAMPVAEEQHRD